MEACARIKLLLSALTAALALSCRTDEDCSLNGLCDTKTSACACDAAWKGTACDALALIDVPNDTLGRVWPPDGNTSSWGANILFRNGSWHMVVSEMAGHCGLHTWTHNSFLRHAVSRTADGRVNAALAGPYAAREAVMPWFSHNAMPYALPNGSVVVYHVGLGTPRGANGSHFTNCRDGVTPAEDATFTSLPLAPWAPLPYTDDASNDGNWSWRFANMTLAPGSAAASGGDGHIGNLGPLTFANGTTLLSYTIRSGPFKQSFGLAVGDTPHGPFAPRITGNWSLPVVVTHGEDSFLWRDRRGHYHLLYHTGGATGGHAFSRDAHTWTQSAGDAYTATVGHHGGATKYAMRQRPALVRNGNGQLVALVTGVGLHVGVEHDRTFTHLQKLRLG